MTPNDAIELLTALIPTREPVMLWSAPGCGKSSSVRQAVQNIRETLDKPDFGLRVLIGSQLESVDLRGVPKVDGARTVWCQPSFLPDDGEGVLFLDELPQSSSDVQKCFMQLTLDRRLGDYVLPDGWVVVAAGNRVEDRAGASRVLSALLNRFATHIDIEVGQEGWQDWAVANNILPEVRSFIRFRPELLFSFDPATNPRSFPTPRTWHKVSTILPVTPKRLLLPTISGAVGAGPAAEFIAYLEFFKNLPDIDAVLAKPDTHPLPTKEPAVMFALIGAMVDRAKKNPALVKSFARVGVRLPDEFGMLALRDALAMDRKLVTDPAIQSWISSARKKGLFVGA